MYEHLKTDKTSVMDKHDVVLQLQVERPLYEQEALNRACRYENPETSSIKTVTSALKPPSFGSCLISLFPILSWIRQYRWKEDTVPDIISGFTVAIMHIPQGMAYALLGNLPPVVGIYMAFFPVLGYFFFGTSKHVSMGTFAVVCLMTGKAVTAHATLPDLHPGIHDNSTLVHNFNESLTTSYTPIQVATVVTLLVGIFQILMYIFRLGIISTLLSETLVNSFTTGAAVHVLISQIKDLLGIKIPKQNENFKIIYTAWAILHEITNVNLAAVVISCTAIVILVINNEILKPWANKRCSIPIPIELIAVVSGTLISTYCDLPNLYNIKTVGHIPTGLPYPELPKIELVSAVAVDSIAVTMVSYTITLSMALIFAQKLNYEINSNQELLAMGVGNIIGSFFSCMPVSASLSRSLIQQSVGGRTQIASLVSCGILLVILLWIGPFFEPLPRCVLASIIVVALKGMFMQASEIVKYWKLNKFDATLWIITFSVTVVVNIDIGLLAGLLTSLVIILLQTVRPYVCLLGHIPDSELYLDLSRYKAAIEIPKIKIVHYCGSLNFANSQYFKSEVCKLVNVDPQKILKRNLKLARKGCYDDERDFEDKNALRVIILDMSAITYMDPSSVTVLRSLVKEFAQIRIQFHLAGCQSPVFETLKKCDTYVYGDLSFRVFATIQDAVTYTRNELLSS